MEHPGIRRLHPDEDHFCVISGSEFKSMHDDVKQLIGKIGAASSRAQGLGHVITTIASFSGSDNTIYLLLNEENKAAVGFVKVGRKQLFLWDRNGQQHEMRILCLLDFFTCPDCQRRGYGKKMIDKMLSDQNLEMKQVPIDRPSALCLSFMNKQFGLSEYLPQSNNFVVFDEFWETRKRARSELPPINKPKPLIGLGVPAAHRAKLIAPTPVQRVPGLGRVANRGRSHLNPITWAPY